MYINESIYILLQYMYIQYMGLILFQCNFSFSRAVGFQFPLWEALFKKIIFYKLSL